MLGLRDYFYFAVILGTVCVVPVDGQLSEDSAWADVLPFIIAAAVICVILFCIIILLVVCIIRWRRQQQLNINQSNLDVCYENTAVTSLEIFRDSVDQIKGLTESDCDDGKFNVLGVSCNDASAVAQVSATKNSTQHLTDDILHKNVTTETVNGHTYEILDHSRKHPCSDCVIENLFTDDKPSTLKIANDQMTKPKPYLVAINIPCDDSDVPTIVENQSNSDDALVVENSLTTAAAAHSADDIKEIVASGNEKLQSCAPTMHTVHSYKNPDEISDDTDYVIENLCTNDVPSPTINNSGNRSGQKVAPKPSSCMVAINIPHDDSGVPTLAKNIGTHDKCTANEGCDDMAAHITISETSANDKTIELQRNPAYNVIHHASSGVHSYEEISYATVSVTSINSSSTNDTTVKMEKNPAYHAIKHAEPTVYCRNS